ncbi:hypothetical protein GYH30_000530 [Glycine max]|uniref:Uncharacterized protein n=2 Tax=Glycine subgen. Soja TaxID=1462606 RepID=K7K1W3_SOYBN|nr:hypothetical protein GYH30_000530 [Glycine max]
MQSDFLPNFILCNTTQRFIRSSRVVLVQKPFVQPFLPSAKPSFYCGTQITLLEPMITTLQDSLPKSFV